MPRPLNIHISGFGQPGSQPYVHWEREGDPGRMSFDSVTDDAQFSDDASVASFPRVRDELAREQTAVDRVRQLVVPGSEPRTPPARNAAPSTQMTLDTVQKLINKNELCKMEYEYYLEQLQEIEEIEEEHILNEHMRRRRSRSPGSDRFGARRGRHVDSERGRSRDRSPSQRSRSPRRSRSRGRSDSPGGRRQRGRHVSASPPRRRDDDSMMSVKSRSRSPFRARGRGRHIRDDASMKSMKSRSGSRGRRSPPRSQRSMARGGSSPARRRSESPLRMARARGGHLSKSPSRKRNLAGVDGIGRVEDLKSLRALMRGKQESSMRSARRVGRGKDDLDRWNRKNDPFADDMSMKSMKSMKSAKSPRSIRRQNRKRAASDAKKLKARGAHLFGDDGSVGKRGGTPRSMRSMGRRSEKPGRGNFSDGNHDSRSPPRSAMKKPRGERRGKGMSRPASDDEDRLSRSSPRGMRRGRGVFDDPPSPAFKKKGRRGRPFEDPESVRKPNFGDAASMRSARDGLPPRPPRKGRLRSGSRASESGAPKRLGTPPVQKRNRLKQQLQRKLFREESPARSVASSVKRKPRNKRIENPLPPTPVIPPMSLNKVEKDDGEVKKLAQQVQDLKKQLQQKAPKGSIPINVEKISGLLNSELKDSGGVEQAINTLLSEKAELEEELQKLRRHAVERQRMSSPKSDTAEKQSRKSDSRAPTPSGDIQELNRRISSVEDQLRQGGYRQPARSPMSHQSRPQPIVHIHHGNGQQQQIPLAEPDSFAHHSPPTSEFRHQPAAPLPSQPIIHVHPRGYMDSRTMAGPYHPVPSPVPYGMQHPYSPVFYSPPPPPAQRQPVGIPPTGNMSARYSETDGQIAELCSALAATVDLVKRVVD